MLIHWGPAPGGAPLNLGAEFVEFAQEILRARRKGTHVISIHPDILREMKGLNLSDLDLSVLDRMIDEYTQVGGGIKAIRPAVRLINSWDFLVEGDGGIINVSLKSALDLDIFDTPILLVENLKNDGFLYKLALKETSQHPLKFLVDHGGGGDIANVFEEKMKQRKIVACVVDSDKYTPHSKKNEKLAAIETRLKRQKWPLAFTLSPSCREVENMIPLEAICALPCGKGHSSNDVLASISGAESGESSERFWSYFDIKKGVVFGKISKLNDEEFDWVAEKLKVAGILISREASEEMGADAAAHSYLIGYGEKVVDQVARSPEATLALVKYFEDEIWNACFRETIYVLQNTFSALSPVRA